MYHTILFDLDGTLTDPGVGITSSVAYALQHYGITVSDRSELYRFIGPPLQDAFQEYYGFSKEQADEAVLFYRERFRSIGIFENEIYPGIDEMLRDLKKAGKTLLLATSKPEEFANTILKHFHIDSYFSCVTGSTFDGKRAKKAEVIEEVFARCGITDKSGVVMVGDREHDIHGANATGLDSIGILYGYGCREEHEAAGATHIVETVEALRTLLLCDEWTEARL